MARSSAIGVLLLLLGTALCALGLAQWFAWPCGHERIWVDRLSPFQEVRITLQNTTAGGLVTFFAGIVALLLSLGLLCQIASARMLGLMLLVLVFVYTLVYIQLSQNAGFARLVIHRQSRPPPPYPWWSAYQPIARLVLDPLYAASLVCSLSLVAVSLYIVFRPPLSPSSEACPLCGYCLRGVVSLVCPECGSTKPGPELKRGPWNWKSGHH